MTETKKNVVRSFNNNKKNRSISKKPLSDSGIKRFLDQDISTETLTELKGWTGSCNFKKMSKNDGIVGGIINAYINPITSATWTIKEIENATSEEEEIREVLNAWFFEVNDFNVLLIKILGMLSVGFSCFEMYYRPFEYNGKTYMMPVLEERVQTSIYNINYKEDLVKQLTTENSYVDIPLKNLVFFTFRQEGTDLRGVSLLRQAYKDYKDKVEIKGMAKKGIARSILGLPIGKVPKNVNQDSNEYSAFEEAIIDLGERDSDGMSDSLVIPENYSVELLTSDFNIDELEKYLAYYDTQMTLSVLAQFLLLGQNGNGGAYALGRDQSDMFLDGLQYIVKYIEQVFNKEIIYPTVQINFEEQDVEKFGIAGLNLNKKNNKEFADTLKVLLDAKILKPELEDEVQIRKMYDLPEIDLKKREKESENKKEEEKEIKDNPNNEKIEIETTEEKIVKLSESWKTGNQRVNYIDQETDKLDKYSRASLTLIADKLSQAIRRQMKKGKVEAQGLKDIKLNNVGSYKKGMGKKLATIGKLAWNNALKNSKNKIKLAEEINPSDLPNDELKSFVINQSDLMTEKQMEDLRAVALLVANTQLAKGLSINQAMSEVNREMDEFIESSNIDVANELAVVQTMNYSEMQFYDSIQDELWGYEFSNPDPKTDICQSLVGKTYRKDSTELAQITPPLHFRCKSYLSPIYKTEKKPDFDNFIPPPKLMEQKTI